jgi:Spy/CpxP family protein refolding chaperone
MRGIRCVLAAVLAAGIVTVVAAQPGRQFGGFGPQDAFMLVATNTALQDEIKATDAQKEAFKAIAEKQAEMNKKVFEKYNKDAFAEAKDDKDKFKELITGMNKETTKVREEVLKLVDAKLTEPQKKRLKQINVQVMGINVFSDPNAKTGGGFGGFGGGGMSDSQKATMKEVTDALKLTDDQKTKIKGILEEYTKDRDSIRKDIFGDSKKGGFDPDKQKDFQTKTSKLSTEFIGKIADALDDAQKKTWKELVGEPFDVAKLRPTFPKKD